MRSSGNASTKLPYVGFFMSDVDEERDFRLLVLPENDKDAGLLLTGISVGAEMVGYVLVYSRRICWLLTRDFTRASHVSVMHTSIHFLPPSAVDVQTFSRLSWRSLRRGDSRSYERERNPAHSLKPGQRGSAAVCLHACPTGLVPTQVIISVGWAADSSLLATDCMSKHA
jgi:hypothetical protein